MKRGFATRRFSRAFRFMFRAAECIIATKLRHHVAMRHFITTKKSDAHASDFFIYSRGVIP